MSAELVEDTMNEIRRNWNITLQDQFNPIPLALEMLQESNPSHDNQSFLRLRDQLQSCMEFIVEKNYAGFNGAVATFGGIVENIKEARSISLDIKSSLEEFRDQIQYKRTDLPELWAKIEKYKLKIAAMESITQMKILRKKALDLAKKRFFVPAAKILHTIGVELQNVGDILESVDREFFIELKEDHEQFLENIVDEFCNHTFLKVPTSTALLYANALGHMQSLGEIDCEFVRQQSQHVVSAPEGDLVLIPSEFSFNPDSNAISYICSLVQAAIQLGSVQEFVNALEQRLSSELFLISEFHFKDVYKRYHRAKIDRDISLTRIDLEIFISPSSYSKSDLLELKTFSPFLAEVVKILLVKFAVILASFELVAKEFSKFDSDQGQLLFDNAVKIVRQETRNVFGTFLKGTKLNLQTQNFSLSETQTTTVQNSVAIYYLSEVSYLGRVFLESRP